MKYIVIILAASIVSGCNSVQKLNIITLADFSSRDSALIDWYKATIRTSILSHLGPQDRLTVLPIDYSSQTATHEFFRVDFGTYTFGNEYAGLQQDEVKKKNLHDSILVAIGRFDTVFEMERRSRLALPEGTDIFGALRQVQKYVLPEYKTILVITSDMLQFTDKVKINFEAHLNNVEDIDRYLSATEQTDLAGIQIIVLTGPQPAMTPAKFNAIKGFWEQYFTLCNGELIDYSSGSVSKLEQVISL